MWLEDDKFKEMSSAVNRGELPGLRRLLGELFHPENQPVQKLTFCPRCQKPLEKKMHPYLEYFVQACPDKHGIWLTPDVCEKVRDLFESQIMVLLRRRKIVRFLTASAAGFLLFITIAQAPVLMSALADYRMNPEVSASIELQRRFGVFPIEEKSFSDFEIFPQEQQYWIQTGRLLELGAVNRMILEKKIKRARFQDQRRKAFEDYQEDHREFMRKLRAVYVPAALNPFHESLERAAEAQIAFYGETAARSRKIESAHPAARACHQELLDAYHWMETRYPPSAVRDALKARLCAFDVI